MFGVDDSYSQSDISFRNDGYPETHISLIEVDLQGPNHWVTLTWSGPNASLQKTGPFKSSPGRGLGSNNCDDVEESNRIGSQCTPKGMFVVEGVSDALSTNANATFVTWIDMRRSVAMHYFPDVPSYPASAGCIRLERASAQLVHNNVIVGQTTVEVKGKWTRPFDLENFRAQLIETEGRLNKIDYDSLGNPTIGVGFNLARRDARAAIEAIGASHADVMSGKAQLSDSQVDSLLSRDIEQSLRSCREIFSNFDELSDVRQRVLADMMFNLGLLRFQSFKTIISAVRAEDFDLAADEIRKSGLHGEFNGRVVSLESQMRTSGVEAALEELPIVDSQMTREQALEGVSADCPDAIKERLELIDVDYYSFDRRLHRGQLVVDRDLVEDVRVVFSIARSCRFPIGSVVPVSHSRFRRNAGWDDDLSMEANNSSAFNFRKMTGSSVLSNHSWGRAIDINPMQNPYIAGGRTSPSGAQYDAGAAGTLSVNHPVTQAFFELGWDWGGSWIAGKDYQHFEKSNSNR
jgi:peptidoglycan LD-endopeptidase CwlK